MKNQSPKWILAAGARPNQDLELPIPATYLRKSAAKENQG